jgi:hypothetical protein
VCQCHRNVLSSFGLLFTHTHFSSHSGGGGHCHWIF